MPSLLQRVIAINYIHMHYNANAIRENWGWKLESQFNQLKPAMVPGQSTPLLLPQQKSGFFWYKGLNYAVNLCVCVCVQIGH